MSRTRLHLQAGKVSLGRHVGQRGWSDANDDTGKLAVAVQIALTTCDIWQDTHRTVHRNLKRQTKSVLSPLFAL